MFRHTRESVERRIDQATSDVRDLTETLDEVRTAMFVLSAALVLLSMVIAFTDGRD